MMLYLALVLMTLLGAVASLLLKKACVNLDLRHVYRNGWFFGGGGLYFVTALMNIALLKYLDYSVVLPFTSLTYVWSALLSVSFLKERISRKQKIGLALIVLGAFMLVM
ncbi:MAG: EamA family transporter [Fibrobacter sp.]|nr:EamA family transporter [Fibrobacter sp.]